MVVRVLWVGSGRVTLSGHSRRQNLHGELDKQHFLPRPWSLTVGCRDSAMCFDAKEKKKKFGDTIVKRTINAWESLDTKANYDLD
jgi:hypothetical protein